MIWFLDPLLAPIARLLVARGVLFADAADRLKQAYVDAAARRAGGRATDSRISVMTGLQRRDVVRLRGAAEPAPRPVNHLSRLVAVWQTDARYAGRDLPRKDATDGFEALALDIRRDVHPRTMLDELLAAGTVALVDPDLVRLVQTSFQPLAGSEAQLAYFTANAGDFLAAATGNLLVNPAPFFERAAHYNQLSAEAVAALDRQFRDGQMALLREISQTAAQLQATSPGTQRFRAGGWFYHEDEVR